MSEGEEKKKKKKRWLPLESNYVTMNEYAGKLGASTDYTFGDIYGFGDEINWVPQPCLAVLLVFPITEENEKIRKEEEEKFKDNKVSEKVYFMKQTIGNACGTIGLLHAVLNNAETLKLKGPIKEFYEKTLEMDALERCKFLEDFKAIEDTHKETAQDEKNVVLKEEDLKSWRHFLSFVNVDDHLYELDGRRPNALNRGKTSKTTFLKDVAAVVKGLMKINPDKPYDFAAVFYSKK